MMILIILNLVFTALSALLLIRNPLVYAYLTKLINLIRETNQYEVDHYVYDFYPERYNALVKVPYSRMIFTFWRPLPWHFRDSILAELAQKANEDIRT